MNLRGILSLALIAILAVVIPVVAEESGSNFAMDLGLGIGVASSTMSRGRRSLFLRICRSAGSVLPLTWPSTISSPTASSF